MTEQANDTEDTSLALRGMVLLFTVTVVAGLAYSAGGSDVRDMASLVIVGSAALSSVVFVIAAFTR